MTVVEGGGEEERKGGGRKKLWGRKGTGEEVGKRGGGGKKKEDVKIGGEEERKGGMFCPSGVLAETHGTLVFCHFSHNSSSSLFCRLGHNFSTSPVSFTFGTIPYPHMFSRPGKPRGCSSSTVIIDYFIRSFDNGFQKLNLHATSPKRI